MEKTVYKNTAHGECIGSWPLDDGKTVTVIEISVHVGGAEVDHKLAILGQLGVIMMDHLDFFVIRYGAQRKNGLKMFFRDNSEPTPDDMEIHLTVVSQSMQDFVRPDFWQQRGLG